MLQNNPSLLLNSIFQDVFMIPDTTVLNTKTVAEIVRMGYTRIPIYSDGDKNNVTDILFVKVEAGFMPYYLTS